MVARAALDSLKIEICNEEIGFCFTKTMYRRLQAFKIIVMSIPLTKACQLLSAKYKTLYVESAFTRRQIDEYFVRHLLCRRYILDHLALRVLKYNDPTGVVASLSLEVVAVVEVFDAVTVSMLQH